MKTISFWHHRRRLILIAPVILCMLVLTGCEAVQVDSVYEHGVVATSAPLATALGVKVLQQGGNAFDAAVAVGFALAVVHPEAGNIGGGGFAVIRHTESEEVRALDFRETAPAAASADMFLDEEGNVIEDATTVGALAAGVPGTVAGLHELWRTYGSLPWEELIGYAAEMADTGFVVSDDLSSSLARHRSALTQYRETRDTFFPEGATPPPGSVMKLKPLARTLYRIAAEGPDGFYGGEVADSIVATMEAHGGLITHQDLADYDAIWRTPIMFEFDSLKIYSMPPPSSGAIVLGQILKLLEPFSFDGWTPATPEYIHLFTETARLAYADRAEHLGDPSFYDIPVQLLDSGYLERRRALIDPSHASPSTVVRPSLPPAETSDETTHYSVCDVAGNMVAVTYTINTSFGSKLIVGGAGFLLNNEMDDFVAKPGVPNVYGLVGGEANKIEPGKRMLSSMTPTLILREEQPYLILGSPGGSKIITTVAQTILNITRFDYTLAEAVAEPRFHHQWLPDVLYLEKDAYDITVKQSLIGLGHYVQEREPFGDVQAIAIDVTNLKSVVADPREAGKADGY
jgi:gamma-glutamyltranspeptidase/glutathione hydrolase